MKKLIILLLLTIPLFAEEPRPYILYDFTGGLNLKDATIKLQDNETPACSNVLFDETNALYSRQGFSLLATLPVSGNIYLIDEFNRQSGENWLMVHIATSIYATKDVGTTWLLVIEGLSEVYGGNAVTYDNEWWFTDGVDDVISWNTSTTTAYGFIPQGKFIEIHNNQMFIANVPENYSAIFWCSSANLVRDINGWQYTNSWLIGENEGDTITGLKSEGAIITVHKQDSLWYISGDGSYYDVPVKYTDVYGNMSQKSMSKYKRSPLFLSRQGICSFAQGSIRQVDRRIEDLTKSANISVGTIVGKYWNSTTENDFYLGTSSDVTVTDGVIRVLTSNVGEGIIDATNRPTITFSRYNLGYEGVGTGEYVDEYIEKTDMTLGSENSFTSGAFDYIRLPTDSATKSWSVSNVGINLKRTTSDVFRSSVTVKIYNGLDEVLGTETRWFSDLGNGDWYTYFTTHTVTVPMTFKVKAFYRGSGNKLTGAACLTTSYPRSKWVFYTETKSGNLLFPHVTNMKNSGWELVKTQITKIGLDDYFYLSWRKQVAFQQWHALALKYSYEMNPSTWGFYTSQKFNAGTNLNTWKHFVTGDAGDGITYQVRYATGSTALDIASWNTITNGSLIGATTSQYWIQWKALLNDENQIVESVMLRWFEVNAADYQDVSADFFKNRYHLAYSTYNYTNHIITIYDSNGKFTNWDITAETLGVYDNQLLFGSDSKIYKMYDTWNDNGAAINKYWESKDIDFGTPDRGKNIENIGITCKGSGTLGLKWRSNYDTTWSTAAITLNSTWQNEVIGVPKDSPIDYLRIRVDNNAVDEYFEVSEIRIYYTLEPLKIREY